MPIIFLYMINPIGRKKMKKYIGLELEVKNIKTIDIITTSPIDVGQDTPGVGMDDSMLGD